MKVKRSALIKCRVTPDTKADLRMAARRSSTTDSDLLRALIGHAVDGRSIDEGVRADMMAVRGIANALLDKAAIYDVDPSVFHDLATSLHDLAERRLGSPR